MDTATERVAAAIRSGGVVAYPTEGVWGLGCDPMNETAVQRILTLKTRRLDQGLIVLGASGTQLVPFIKPFLPKMAERIRSSWPGAVTWIVPAASDCPEWLTGGRDTLAVRVTAHRPARQLCFAAGTALVSTSANRHGEAPTRDVDTLHKQFGDELDDILEAPLGDAGGASEIRYAATGEILRAGASRTQ
jgi:L-threonylcarbamoyladenylate synthase